MFELIGTTPQALLGQLLIGGINGAFYAMLSLGLAIIFGLLNIVNFAHGAMYMLGALVAWLLLNAAGVGYWPSLLLAPLLVGGVAMVLERWILRRIYRLDPMYGLLLTLGIAMVVEGICQQRFGVAGMPYAIPESLSGGRNLGFMYLPNYRAWVVAAAAVACIGTWLVIEKTKLGSYLRAATENPPLVRAFGVNVPRMIMWTYGFGAALAALGGVMAAPIYQVSPLMGSNIVIIVFAVVVIGGMGSMLGAIVAGFGLGIIEGLTKVFYPAASTTVIFVVMVLVLCIRPAGLFGKSGVTHPAPESTGHAADSRSSRTLAIGAIILALLAVAPYLGLYSGFLMKAMCFALFACAFNLLIGYAGLMSFGHAAFFGMGAYVAGYGMKAWGITPEIAVLGAAACAALLGLLFGWLAIRRQGIYFAMITLALSQMVYFFCVQAPFTGGEDGLRDIPRGKLFGLIDLEPTMNLYFFVLGVTVLGFLVIYRTIHSPFGQVLKAIRENEPRAISLGYKTNRCKLIVFVISATLAGVAGGVKVLVFQIASLTDVHWAMSGEVVLMTLIGGTGTVFGPVVGAFVMTALEGYLAPLGSWVRVIQGAVFVGCVLVFRRGIVGALADAWNAIGPQRGLAPARPRPDVDEPMDDGMGRANAKPV